MFMESGTCQQGCGAGAEGIMTTVLFLGLNAKQARSVGHWSLKQELIMNTEWKQMTVTCIYLSSFQWIPPSPTPTLLPSFSFGWIAVFEQSVSSCQLSSFAFEPYLSLVSWFLTKDFCCLWVLQRGLSFLQEKQAETQGSCLLKIWNSEELPLTLLLSLTFFPALTQIEINFFCLSIPSFSIYQLYITDNHYRENPGTVH